MTPLMHTSSRSIQTPWQSKRCLAFRQGALALPPKYSPQSTDSLTQKHYRGVSLRPIGCGPNRMKPRPEAKPASVEFVAFEPLIQRPLAIQTPPACSLRCDYPAAPLAPRSTDPEPPSLTHPTIRRRNRLPDCIVDRVSDKRDFSFSPPLPLALTADI
jgi:hypothetical protein